MLSRLTCRLIHNIHSCPTATTAVLQPATNKHTIFHRHLETTASSPPAGLPKVIPEERLSSKYMYTKDGGKLDDVQRQFYESNGFIVIRKLVAQDKLRAYESRFREIANETVRVPGMLVQKDISFKDLPRNENTVYKLQELFLDDGLFDYCRTPHLLDYVQSFCGADVMAVHTMLINKPPDSGTKSSRHPLHQDLHYFPFRPANLIVCAWTAMEHVNRENGCLVAIPGSHRGQLLAHDYPDWEGPINSLYHGVKGMDDAHQRVYVEMGPGDTILFHPLLIHGSGANRTAGYRKAISCHYASSDCQYIDIRGTSQEELAQEVIEIARKRFGHTVDDYSLIWRMRATLVRGERRSM